MGFQGLATLQTPRDLLKKLRHDFARLRQDPTDAYAAFDFFAAAAHMPEWVYPEGSEAWKQKRKAVRELGGHLLEVCSHVANGAKHFVATHPKHKSVRNIVEHRGAFQLGAFDPECFDTDRLVIELAGDAAADFGRSLGVLQCARRILAFWEDHPDLE